MSEETTKKSFFQGVSPKMTFIFGLVVGIAVVSTVGFVTTMSKNSDDDVAVEPTVKGAEVAQAPEPADEPAAEIVVPQITDQDYVKGDANAAITLIEFTDLQCPYCSSFHNTVNQLLQEYSGQIKVTIKHFPLSFHAHAKDAAIGAECAGEQGKYWEYVDAVFENQSGLGDGGIDFLKEQASSIGLNEGEFSSCLTSGNFDAKINQHYSDSIKAGAQGTPYSLLVKPGQEPVTINGAQPIETVKGIVDGLLK